MSHIRNTSYYTENKLLYHSMGGFCGRITQGVLVIDCIMDSFLADKPKKGEDRALTEWAKSSGMQVVILRHLDFNAPTIKNMASGMPDDQFLAWAFSELILKGTAP